jgi:hypothetical protein
MPPGREHDWSMTVGSVLVGCVAVLGLWLVWWNMRRLRTRRLAVLIPDRIRDAVLAAIDQAGMEDGTGVLLLRITARLTDPYSKIGGEPFFPPAMTMHGAAARDTREFLAQIRLQSPPLPECWSNRVVFLFRDATGNVAALSGGHVDPPGESGARVPSTNGRAIERLRLPPGDTADNEDDDVGPSAPYDSRALCRRVPALRRMLADYPEMPERLLPHILVPGISTHEIDTFLVSLMGGEPELIQGEHGAVCSRCSQPMQFLMQFGDVLELGGDAPVVYVYGCNEHPAEVLAYVDVH